MISGHTNVAAVIGSPVRHSLSPAIYNAAFEALGLDWIFVAFEVPAGEGAAAVTAMRSLGLGWLSVTMPHKEAVAGTVDELTPVAETLGAVNTLGWEDGRLVGDSTDAAGLLDALGHEVGVEPVGRRCVVLGAGGAARATVLGLAHAGAAEIVVVNRTPERGLRAAALAGDAGRVGEASDVKTADIVVNATPVGMADTAHRDDVPVDPALLRADQLVVDLIYHPLETPLLRHATARGVRTLNGLPVLVHQAAHQFSRWIGQDAPRDVMLRAAHTKLAS